MTTPDAPRHLPPTPEERLKTISTRAAAGSGDGSTGFYRPVGSPPRRSDTGAGGVTTGEVVADAVSITSTEEGFGSSQSLGYGTVAIGPDSYAIGGPDPSNLGAIAIGVETEAAAESALAVGATSHAVATYPSHGPAAVGPGAKAYGDAALALGRDAHAGAIGAEAAGAVAIGAGANAPNGNDFVLGHSGHNVQVPGKFIIADDVTGALYHVVLSGGALTFVPFP